MSHSGVSSFTREFKVGLFLFLIVAGMQFTKMILEVLKRDIPLDRLLIIVAYIVMMTILVMMYRPPEKGNKKIYPRLLVVVLSTYVVVSVLGMFKHATHDEIHCYNASVYLAVNGFGEFFKNYTTLEWLGIQHPPLSPIIFGMMMKIVGTHQIVSRIIVFLFSAGVLWLIYLIIRDLFDEKIATITVCSLLSMPLFIRLSTLANNDMICIFFFFLAARLFQRLKGSPTYTNAALLGGAASMGLLTKYTMAIIPFFLLLLVIFEGEIRKYFRLIIVALIISSILFSFWLIFAYQSDVLSFQQHRIGKHIGIVKDKHGFIYKTRYSHYRYLVEMFFSRTPIGLGIPNLPLILLAMIIFFKRRYFRIGMITCCFLSIVPIFIMLPDPRYLMPVFPFISLLIVLSLSPYGEWREKIVALSFFFGIEALY